jgi:hypothetical protein
MLTQCPDSPNDMHPIAVAIRQRARQRYYVEVPARPLDEQSRLIDHLIGWHSTHSARAISMSACSAWSHPPPAPPLSNK